MATMKKTLLAAVLGSAVLLGLAAPAPAQFRTEAPPRTNSQFLYAFRDATAEASKSTVRVLCDGKEAALGTVVGADGWILTKNSELTGKVTCKLPDGKEVEAKLVGVQDKFDLAMLKVDARGLTPVKFVESKTAPVGNWVASAGPGDDPAAVGVMSVAARTPSARDAGRVFNPKRGFLGIQMEPVSAGWFGGEGGIKITLVTPRSAAEKGGLKADDLILSVNGHKLTDIEGMQNFMNKTKSGDVLTLKVKRRDKESGEEEEKELKVTLGQAPQDRGDMQNNMGSKLSERRTGFPTYFQHDTVLKPQDCGGPVVDLDGHVLGVNIARAGRTESYAIPSETLEPIIAELKSGKLAPSPAAELEKKLADLKEALKKAEEDKTAAEKKVADTQEALKKQEAEKVEAEKKLKAAKEALEKAEKEAKDKK
jgi:serine protease Do